MKNMSDPELFGLIREHLFTPVLGGRGSVIGSPIAPLIKITGNSQTFAKMKGDIDFDAGYVLNGSKTLDKAAAALASLVTAVAGSSPTKPELLGHREYFIMCKHQNTPSLEQRCPT
jgi:altronate hydrolase